MMTICHSDQFPYSFQSKIVKNKSIVIFSGSPIDEDSDTFVIYEHLGDGLPPLREICKVHYEVNIKHRVLLNILWKNKIVTSKDMQDVKNKFGNFPDFLGFSNRGMRHAVNQINAKFAKMLPCLSGDNRLIVKAGHVNGVWKFNEDAYYYDK